MDYKAVSNFWFGELKPEDWWRKDENLDRLIADRFLGVHAAAARCELYEWRLSPQGRLTEVIVLNQFSRNIFRGTARAFEHDSLALCLAQEAIAAKAHSALSVQQKAVAQRVAKSTRWRSRCSARRELEGNLKFELKHKGIIDRFGRYPHRNASLERQPTEKELEFLRTTGSSF